MSMVPPRDNHDSQWISNMYWRGDMTIVNIRVANLPSSTGTTASCNRSCFECERKNRNRWNMGRKIQPRAIPGAFLSGIWGSTILKNPQIVGHKVNPSGAEQQIPSPRIWYRILEEEDLLLPICDRSPWWIPRHWRSFGKRIESRTLETLLRQVGWRKFRKGGTMGDAWKEKGEPIGTKPDCLVVTAVGCVISWNSFSLTCFSLSILFWRCHFLLLRFALVISESWQLPLAGSCEAQDLTHFSPDNVFLMSSLSLETDVFSSTFHWRLFLLASGIPIFGLPFSWDLLLLTFSSLHIPFSWHGFLLAPFFLYPVVFIFFLLKPLSFETFFSSHVLCLDVVFHSHVFLWASLSLEVFVPCWQNPSCALQNLRKVLPSSTSYYQTCTKYFLRRTNKVPHIAVVMWWCWWCWWRWWCWWSWWWWWLNFFTFWKTVKPSLDFYIYFNKHI